MVGFLIAGIILFAFLIIAYIGINLIYEIGEWVCNCGRNCTKDCLEHSMMPDEQCWPIPDSSSSMSDSDEDEIDVKDKKA